jgi:hypothetical protein
VTVTVWHDRFTGTRYSSGSVWQSSVRRFLVDQLRSRLADRSDVARAADQAADFWSRTYYDLLFPLRFGLGWQSKGELESSEALAAEAHVDLELLADQPLRARFLDADHLPPLLPDPQRGDQGWLLADRLLLDATLLNLLLLESDAATPQQRHAARLAALIAPFAAELLDPFAFPDDPLVADVCAVLNGDVRDLPSPLDTLVPAVRARQLDGYHIGVVQVAAQRIKQYVFDTPGLNEIRGGSTLLDEVVAQLNREISAEIGPEVVLRAAGSVLLFLAPANTVDAWPARLRRAFAMKTGTAFAAAAAIQMPARDLLAEYAQVTERLALAVEADRAQARVPLYAPQPFETPCELCRVRAAELWSEAPRDREENARLSPEDKQRSRRPLCRVCQVKRSWGQDERYGKVFDVLADLGQRTGNQQRPRPGALGVGGTAISDWLAYDLEQLIPTGVRRRLLGVVYGDGNSFGAVASQLSSVALGRQWAARVQATTRAAAALALGSATQAGARLRGWAPGAPAALEKLPFQVLALGGDDISLLAWAPVALHFAAEFTRLTDLELQGTSQERIRPEVQLSFALGVLVSDEKTPVRKSVDFVEEQLLKKWAKQSIKRTKRASGAIAMLCALSVEGIPAQLESYRDETYMLGAGGYRICTTLRPYSAGELADLLRAATNLCARGDLGRLLRLAGAFYGARQSALSGLLHYKYQKGRLARPRVAQDGASAERESRRDWLGQLEGDLKGLIASGDRLFFPPTTTRRAPLGLPEPRAGDTSTTITWFSPLWDLVELAKIVD